MAGVGTRHLISLVDETPVKTDGEWVPSTTTILRTWADVRERSGSRAVQNDQTLLDKFFEFKFRWNGDIQINANVKLVYDGRRYTIHSLEKQHQKKFYWILQAQVKSFS
jgi:SPP1 family predicted phage head-tail adaptor